MLTAPKLRKTLARHTDLVERALAALFPDPREPLNLEGIARGVEEGEDLADLLLATLHHLGRVPHFIAYLRARGADPAPRGRAQIFMQNVARFVGIEIGDPPQTDFDMTLLRAFSGQAEAFRCQIRINARFEGSGAFVAPNLVLTASHVLDPLLASPDARLEIRASDGQDYPAGIAHRWDYHASERTGGLPPPGFIDIALLRVYRPLGQIYGAVDINADPPDFTGPEMFTLVHSPDGRDSGFVSGRIRRDGPGDLRLPHDIDTSGGSSGGPGFDRQFRFLGIHQGRWNNVRRLVPFERFCDDATFQDLIAANRRSKALWSLDRNIDGPLIIGRRQFSTGLQAMLDAPASRLRGLWIRREDTASIRGLGFSYDMLEAMLLQDDRPDTASAHRCIRMTPTSETSDLLGDLAETALDDRSAAEAQQGAAHGQTTEVAREDSRAQTLVQAMQARAAAAAETWWIFFDNPPTGLASLVQVQFEHLARHLPAEADLRLILAGYETYRLAPLRFANVAQAESARRAGLLVEELGPFTRTDVRATLTAMIADLDPDRPVDPAGADSMTDRVLAGLQADVLGQFDSAHLGTVSDRLRQEVKTHLEIAA